MNGRPPSSPLFPSTTLSRSKVGGPSVFPPQPEGVTAVGQVKHDWKVSKGEDRYRRGLDRKSTRLNSSHANISYAVFCLKKKKKANTVLIYYYQSTPST